MSSYGSFPPKRWPRSARSAILPVISLAQASLTHARSWAANSRNARVRLRAEHDWLGQEVDLLQEEIRINDGRMARKLICPTEPVTGSSCEGVVEGFPRDQP